MPATIKCPQCDREYAGETLPERCECGAVLSPPAAGPVDVSQWVVSQPAPRSTAGNLTVLRNGLLCGHWQADLQAPPRRHDAWLSGLAWGLIGMMTMAVTSETISRAIPKLLLKSTPR